METREDAKTLARVMRAAANEGMKFPMNELGAALMRDYPEEFEELFARWPELKPALTVGQLIERLLQFDENLPVVMSPARTGIIEVSARHANLHEQRQHVVVS